MSQSCLRVGDGATVALLIGDMLHVDLSEILVSEHTTNVVCMDTYLDLRCISLQTPLPHHL